MSHTPAPDPKLKYANWESLDPSMNFQAYDRDGWLLAYEKRPVVCLKSEQWLPDGEYEGGQWIEQGDGPIKNWQQTLIERPADQDGPTEPDPSELAHDHNEITYGADDPTEYDPS